MPDDSLDPQERAYWRDFDYALASALKTARIDLRATGTGVDGGTYLDSVLWLLEDETYQAWQRRQEQVAADIGAGGQHTLADFS